MEKWGIRQFQTAMLAGETTSLQIVENCLKRIEQVDQGEAGLHSIIELNPDALSLAESTPPMA